jgi:hypothetical protein
MSCCHLFLAASALLCSARMTFYISVWVGMLCMDGWYLSPHGWQKVLRSCMISFHACPCFLTTWMLLHVISYHVRGSLGWPSFSFIAAASHKCSTHCLLLLCALPIGRFLLSSACDPFPSGGLLLMACWYLWFQSSGAVLVVWICCMACMASSHAHRLARSWL